MRTLLISALFVMYGFSAFAQKSDRILGTWWTEDKRSKVEVYKKGDKYYGKIVWLKENKNPDGSTPRTDFENPDASKRNRPVVGTIILNGLEWDEDDNEWDDGTIYDPKSGSTYDMYAKLEDPNTLYLKGYIGISLIGRSTLWERVK